jgi:rhodanese-related sulfurtransferase
MMGSSRSGQTSPRAFGLDVWLRILGLASAVALFLMTSLDGLAQAASVSLDEARAKHAAGQVLLVDIREPAEHATGVAEGATLLPMNKVPQRWNALPKDKPILLICNTQNRSRAVVDALRKQGVEGVSWVNGGMSEWARRGWPMVKPATP